MIKGCFKIFLILVLLSATVYYIVDKYGGQFWADQKEKFIRTSVDEILEQFNGIDDPYAEEIKEKTVEYFKKIDFNDLENSYEKIKTVITNLKTALEDKKITADEFEKLNKIWTQ